jgi:hypothetical protein
MEAVMDVLMFDRIQNIRDGRRTLLYDPRTPRKIGDWFGATLGWDLMVLICEVTNVSEVHLLDDLANEESVAALGMTREEFFKQWEASYPNEPMADNPLVFRIDFRFIGTQ